MKRNRLQYYLMFVLWLIVSGTDSLNTQAMLPNLMCEDATQSVAFRKSKHSLKFQTSLDTIYVAIVADYALYVKHEQSLQRTRDYVNEVFDQVQAIYAYDGIPIELVNIEVWSSQDPYNLSTANSALSSFRDLTPIHDSYDIIHLLSANDQNHGGTAYLNGLCNRSRAYGYSNVSGHIDTTQSYNWDVHVLAHEIGHSLGTPHTNICVWGPDHNIALDGCGQVDPSCVDADIPSDGGGIMSSCHLYPTGVKLDRGMGNEPSQVIKETILACGRTKGSICQRSIAIDYGVHEVSEIFGGLGAYHHDATHSRWFSYTSMYDDYLTISSCYEGSDTRLFIYQGDCKNLQLMASSDDDCFSGNGLFYASYLDTFFIEKGETIFIEWDDRWSSNGFTFSISGVVGNTCFDGIQNGIETGVDCGGACEACRSPCSEPESLQSLIDNTLVYRTYDTLHIHSEIIAPAQVVISSATSVQLENEFSVENGAVLEISVSHCEDESPSLENE